MSTDRELLELAAKAAGIEIEWNDAWRSYTRRVLHEPAEPYSNWLIWNPLTDDGDALRLAVRLRLEIRMGEHDILVHQGFRQAHCEPWVDEPYTATRRAIVRAAAAIGGAL